MHRKREVEGGDPNVQSVAPLRDCPLVVRSRLHAAILGLSLGVMLIAFLAILFDGTTVGVFLGLPGSALLAYATARAWRGRIEIDELEFRDYGVWRTRRFPRARVLSACSALVHQVPWYGIELELESPRSAVHLYGASFWGNKGRERVDRFLSQL